MKDSPGTNKTNEAPQEAPRPVLGDAGALIRRLGPAGPLALIAMTLPGIGGFVLLGVVSRIAPWLRETQPGSIIVFIAGYALLAGLAILPTWAQSLAAGWAFGLAKGGLAAVLAITIAACLGYVIARRASGDRVVTLIEEHPKAKVVYDALVGGNFARRLLIVFLVRLPPNSPFAMTNLTLAAAKVRTLPYVLGTVLGITPRTLAVAWFGSRLEHLDFKQAEGRWMFIGGLAVTIAVLAVIGFMANHALARVTGMGQLSAASSTSPESSAKG